MDPAVVWRQGAGPDPPEPWPGRHEAFLIACALYSGHRERDLIDIFRGLGEGAKEAAANAAWRR